MCACRGGPSEQAGEEIMVSHGKTGRKCKVAFLHVHVITFLSVGFLCLSLVVPLITCTVDSENNSNSNSNGGVPGRPNSSSSNNEEGLRKELIKVQILQRLGLNDKPQVDLAHKISKDLVLEALRRTENFQEEEEGTVTSTGAATSTTRTTAATGSVNDGEGRRNGKGRRGKSKSSADDSNNNSDAGNYAKTSEIIAFPDKGNIFITLSLYIDGSVMVSIAGLRRREISALLTLQWYNSYRVFIADSFDP